MSKLNREAMKSINSSDIEIRSPLKTAHCAWKDENGNTCGCIATLAITKRSTGSRVICYCEHHAEYILNPRPYYGYYTKNRNESGTIGNGGGFTFGCELETSFSRSFAYSELVCKGWIPTSDSTVNIEYKSLVYHGLNAFVRDIRAVAQDVQDGNIEISPSCCGTHTHVGHAEKIAACMEGYRAYSYRLTSPLALELQANPEACQKLFGRNLGGWARYPERDSMTHTNYINMQHEKTLEFRLPLMRNATQYLLAVQFCKEAASAMYENFGKYWQSAPDNKTLLKHKADIAGNKLIKLFWKYVELV